MKGGIMPEEMIDMDEAELLHIAHAAYLLEDHEAAPIWNVYDALAQWRRRSIAGSWNRTALPLYLWITVKET